MAGPTQLLVINAKDPRLSMDLMDLPGAALELLVVALASLLRMIAVSISLINSLLVSSLVEIRMEEGPPTEDESVATSAVSDMD
jgi:hypothetical protein